MALPNGYNDMTLTIESRSMTMFPTNTSSTPAKTPGVLNFPGRALVERPEAARILGVSRYHLHLMHTLGCGLPSVRIRNRSFFRREELIDFQKKLLASVHVTAADRIHRMARDERTTSTATYGRPPLPAHDSHLDPLMTLLAKRAIRHRLFIGMLWAMTISGGTLLLLLY